MQPNITSEFRQRIGQAAVDAAKVSPFTVHYFSNSVHGDDLVYGSHV